MTVRWGLVSTAAINKQIIAAAAESDRAEIIAVGGRDLERTREYARQHGVERAYEGYDALLDDPDVEAVYISLPNSMHVEWVVRALEAGKHVLCEKPLTGSVHDAERAFDAAEANGRLLMEALMYRHHAQTRKLAELVGEGEIDGPRVIRTVFVFNGVRIFGDRDNIRFDRALDGGALMDLGAYCVSAARLLGGEPRRVFGTQVLGRGGVDIAFFGTLEFEDGLVAQLAVGFNAEARSEIEVLGTGGRIVVAQPWRIIDPGIEVVTPEGVTHVDIPRANSYRLELDNLSAAIVGEQEPLLGREDAVGQARVLEALAASAASGSPVAL